MKKLVILTILSLVSLSCFSQTGISKDTTKVVISQQVAKQIAKDLIRLDGCVEELKLTQEKLILTQQISLNYYPLRVHLHLQPPLVILIWFKPMQET